VEGRQADTQAEIYNIDLDHSSKLLSIQEDTEVQEAVEVVTTAKLITEVVTAAATQIAVVAPAVSTRKRKGVVIRDPEEELHTETPAETPAMKDKDWNAAFDHVQAKETQYIKRYHGFKKKPQSESEARKNMISYLMNTEGYKMEYFKGLTINETPAQKAAKRRRLREQAKEDEDLKKQLEVVVDKDDDVFIEATPIGRKVPVVNYEIVMINNKPREDLEDLWKIVKARFSTSKPTNFSNDYLLATLKTMFEKTDAQDVIWRSQQTKYGQALRYPLSKFTLEQLVNVAKLKVEEESEMSLELLRSKENTKCVSAAAEELTTAKHKLILLI
nr:hypothetical protein [Tanacetum cinerariifolium]